MNETVLTKFPEPCCYNNEVYFLREDLRDKLLELIEDEEEIKFPIEVYPIRFTGITGIDDDGNYGREWIPILSEVYFIHKEYLNDFLEDIL